MAELGQTTDPKQLIPGEPGQIAADLRAMIATVQQVDATGDRLSRVDSAQWRGDASEAFRAAYGADVPKWVQVSEMLAKGGDSLANYGGTLAWSQQEAQRAIELYTQAQAATRSAIAAHDTRVQFGMPVGPMVDPGATQAQEAKEILRNARQKVDDAGTDAARSLGFEPDGKGGFTTTDLGGRSGGTRNRKTDKDGKDPGGWQKHKGGGRSYQGEWGSKSSGLFTDTLGDTLKGLGVKLPEATAAAGAATEVAGAHGHGGFTGPVSGDWEANASALGAGAEAHAGANPLGAYAGASAEAHLGEADAGGQIRVGDHAGASGGVDAQAGGHGSIDGTVGPLGAKANGDVFAGAEVNGQAGAEVGGVSAGAHGGASFGVGADASVDFGAGTDGKLHFGGSVGVSLGPGFDVGFDVSVDPGEVVDTVGDAAKSGWHAAQDGVTGAVKGGGNIVKHILGIG